MRTRDRNRTQFCFIAPGSMLDRYASVSKTHLVLPQVTNEAYIDFYKRKRREGDLIILDNGAYEGVKDWSLLIKAMDRYNPQIVCLPDFLLQDGEKTFEEARGFMHLWKNDYPRVKWMYVPQAVPGDIVGFYKWMNIAIKDLKVEWVALPRAIATHIATGPRARYARPDLCEELSMRGIKTHALGMANADLKELELLFWEGCCSIDNSSPIWRGRAELLINSEYDRELWDRNGCEVDFDFHGNITARQHHFIIANMNLILKTLGKETI